MLLHIRYCPAARAGAPRLERVRLVQAAQADRQDRRVGLRASARPRAPGDARQDVERACSRRPRAWSAAAWRRSALKPGAHRDRRGLSRTAEGRGDARRAHQHQRQDRRAAMTPRAGRSARSRPPASGRRCASGCGSIPRSRPSTSSASRCWSARSRCSTCACSACRARFRCAPCRARAALDASASFLLDRAERAADVRRARHAISSPAPCSC